MVLTLPARSQVVEYFACYKKFSNDGTVSYLFDHLTF